MNKTFKYVVGWDPYHFGNGDYHSKGNGTWNTMAPSIEDALKIIFGSMPFPTEATGRKFFQPGLSLDGVHRNEVIQVWSSEPEVIARTRKWLGRTYDRGGLHDGNNRSFGLHMELKVADIDRYLVPVRALLGVGDLGQDNTATQLSPMGASLVHFDEMKHELRQAIQTEKMAIARKQWDIEEISEGMEAKVKLLQSQLYVLDAYLHGTKTRTQVCSGTPGKGKYAVFQNRQYLSEEIALLANFHDMDFADVEKLEKWLVKTGRIWKFLPFERCILATRIRKDDKDYHDPLVNLWNHYLNMQNMIWIRDGQNVYHVDVEFKFTNAVFPDKNQFERAVQKVQDYVWEHSFKWKQPMSWHDTPLKPSEYDHDGQMRRKPLEEEEPYCTTKIINKRFHTIQEWLESPECYPELLDKQIKTQTQDYLREANKKQMVFAVILQGIVDNTNLLDVPKGTDLFDWENIDRYFTLLYDYTHGLPWDGLSKKIAPFIGYAKPGDWIAACLNEYVRPPKAEGDRYQRDGVHYKERDPMLFKVMSLEEGKPVVQYHPIRTRRVRDENYMDFAYGNKRPRVKAPIKLVLAKSDFVRVPMPPSLAEQILDDREWKKTHEWAVQLMVNYPSILKALKTGVNGTSITWKDPE